MVSIIVPVYNSASYLEKCVRSILEQSCEDFELLLIDDCSSDGSYGKMREFAESDKRVRCLKTQQNGGPSAARNLGLENAKGEWISFVDSDDWIEKDYIQNLLKTASECQADIAVCGIVNHDKTQSTAENAFSGELRIFEGKSLNAVRKVILTERTETGVGGLEFTGPVCKLFRRKIVGDKRFPGNVNYGEDTCFVLECIDSCSKVAFINRCGYHRIVRENSLSYIKDNRYAERKTAFVNTMLRYLTQNGYPRKIRNQFVFVQFVTVVNYYSSLNPLKRVKDGETYIRSFIENINHRIDFASARDRKILKSLLAGEHYLLYKAIYDIYWLTGTLKPGTNGAKFREDKAEPQANGEKPQADKAKPEMSGAKPQESRKPQMNETKPKSGKEKMKTDRVLAGIILYNPDLGRLTENFESIASQTDGVVFIDNASGNIEQVEALFGNRAAIVKNDRNLGVAAALNQMFDYAVRHGFDAVITLDQDSVAMPGLIEKYRESADAADVGLITCKIIDRNFGHDRLDDKQKQWIEEQEFVITSGSFCSVAAYRQTDGFDEQMFIDSVDFDYCIQLRKKGFKIYRINFEGLLHEVGHGKMVKILWRDFPLFNHPPFRNYYMARNDIYLTRKHSNRYNPVYRVIVREIISIWLIIRYEEQKTEKLKARWKGVREAFSMKLPQ